MDRKAFVGLGVGCVMYAVGTHAFVEPAQIAPGGAMGVALMISYLSALPVGLLTLAVNVPLLVLAWFRLSRRFAVRTGLVCVACSLVLDYGVAPFCPIYTGDRLLSSLYGGILVGVGMALIFLSGSTSGGSDVLGYLVQKKWPHIQIGKALLAIDGCVLCLSALVFGDIDAALFGMLSLYAQTKVIDALLYGTSAGVQASIITQKPSAITQRIIDELGRSATVVRATGAYSGQELSIVICTARKAEFPKLKELVYASDTGAFVMVNPTLEVYGLGFKDFREPV